MPMGPYADFEACVKSQLADGKDQDSADRICGAIKRDVEASLGGPVTMDAERRARALSLSRDECDEVEAALSLAFDESKVKRDKGKFAKKSGGGGGKSNGGKKAKTQITVDQLKALPENSQHRPGQGYKQGNKYTHGPWGRPVKADRMFGSHEVIHSSASGWHVYDHATGRVIKHGLGSLEKAKAFAKKLGGGKGGGKSSGKKPSERKGGKEKKTRVTEKGTRKFNGDTSAGRELASEYARIHNDAAKKHKAAFAAVGARMWNGDDAHSLKPKHIASIAKTMSGYAKRGLGIDAVKSVYGMTRPLTVLDSFPKVRKNTKKMAQLDAKIDAITADARRQWRTALRQYT